ncbi:MAG TPA: tetratricopeptide repeat protein, partial [Desulfuromonadales bacterium]|nr:tetratricopeptide repeat protein [Desulfuromonadales bacterium]
VQGQCGDLSAAMGSFARALDLDADNLPALKGLAKAKHQSGDAAAARQLLEKAATLAPDDEALRQFLKRLPPDPEEKASEPIPSAPSPQPSVRSSRRGHRTSADPFTTVTIAEIYIRQGFLRRALKIYRDLLSSDPSDENIRQRLIALKQQIAEQEQLDIDVAEEKGAEAAEAEAAIGRGDEEPESPQAPAVKAPAVEGVPPVSSESFTTPPEERGEPLAVLTRWLDAIRQRRAHVS